MTCFPAGVSVARRRWSWLVVVVMVLAIAGPVVGAWNPWHLVVIDRVLFHPVLAGGIVAAGLGWLCHVHVRHLGLRVLVFGAVGAAASAWALAWWMLASLEPPLAPTGVVESPYNDVEVAVRANEEGSTSSIWLRADRGLASRENKVGLVGSAGSGAPSLDAHFDAPDRVIVTHGGEIVYRVQFDPHDLDLLNTQCHTLTPPDTFTTVTSCLDRHRRTTTAGMQDLRWRRPLP